MGSIQDRVMREMVFRERTEKVAHLSAIARMVGLVLNVDGERTFGNAIAEYASEVFQETYDADLLRVKVARIKRTQDAIRKKRDYDKRMMNRLDRMSEFYDLERGVDLMPKAPKPPARKPPPPSKPRKK